VRSFVRCPFCGDEDSRVVDSRDSESGDSIRRRRECGYCGRRYTTYERVEEAPLLVIKRSGVEEVFARPKLLNGLLRACEKRHISLERIERVADEIEGELRRESVQRVTSAEIGERALHHLRDLDRAIVADIVNAPGRCAGCGIGRHARPIWICCRNPVNQPHYCFGHIVDISEIAPHLAVVEQSNRLAR